MDILRIPKHLIVADLRLNIYNCQIEDFLHSIEKNAEPAVTAIDGRKTVELFTAIYKSSQTNLPVKFPLK